nr:MAG TPA: hypothetical protein [Microviridae sp.]
MEKFVIFYEHLGDHGYVYIDAEDLSEALVISDAFYRRTGRLIVGVCKETLLNFWCHE